MHPRTELGSSFTIDRRASPIIWPSDVPILPQRNHWLNGKCHTRLTLTNGLVLCIVRDIWGTVKKFVDAMAAVCSNDTAVLLLGMLFDDVAKLADENTWFDCLYGFLETFSSRFYDPNIVRIGLGLVPNIVCLVQIGMITFVVQ